MKGRHPPAGYEEGNDLSMKRVSRFIIGMIMCVAMIAAFTPLAPSLLPDGIAGALAPETAFAEDGDYTLTYKDGKLVADNIYCGPGNTWEIGLKRFGKEKQEFTLEIDSLEASQKGQIYLENWPYIPNNDGAEFEAGFVSDAIKIDNQFSPKNAVCSLDGITSEHSLLVEFDLV